MTSPRRRKILFVSGSLLFSVALLVAVLFCDIMIGNSRVIVRNETGDLLRDLKISGKGVEKTLTELPSGGEWTELPDFGDNTALSFSCRDAGGFRTWASTEANFGWDGYLIEMTAMPDGRIEKHAARVFMPFGRWFWRRPHQRLR